MQVAMILVALYKLQPHLYSAIKALPAEPVRGVCSRRLTCWGGLGAVSSLFATGAACWNAWASLRGSKSYALHRRATYSTHRVL